MDEIKEEQCDTQSNSHVLTEINISNDNLFTKNKNALKEFSEKLPQQIVIPVVRTEGWFFGLNDHTVKGEELNEVTVKFQDILSNQSETLRKVVQEFNVIYDTFSALDKVYVSEIVTSLNAAIEASNKADQSLEDLSIHHKAIEANQNDIKNLIDTSINNIQALKQSNNERKESIERIEEQQRNLEHSYDDIQSELNGLRDENTKLSKALILTNRISIASLILSFVLIILFFTGVLR